MRAAAHWGSWYSKPAKSLDAEMTKWLSDAKTVTEKDAVAVICPHAGYRYCGSTAAYSFRHMNLKDKSRVFIFGPSHHMYLPNCALPEVSSCETPFGSLTIDRETVSRLRSNTEGVPFSTVRKRDDENEHSLEMQMPFIKKAMNASGVNLPIVPIVVGGLAADAEEAYGALLAPFVRDPSNVFVISSDFCHWGMRFDYQFVEKSWGSEIWQSIEHLDHLGVDAIASLKAKEFVAYLGRYENTICGRHGIAVFLHAVEKSGRRLRFELANYSQSSHVVSPTDSSVSYVSMVLHDE